jgi:uncharacterized protein (DUF58 family)
MQTQFRSVRLSGWLGLLLILAALVVVPFALLFGLVMLVLGLVGSMVSFLLGRRPRPAVDGNRSSTLKEPPAKGKVLDAEYEVKDDQ